MTDVRLFLTALVISAAVDPDSETYDWDDVELGLWPGQWEEMVKLWNNWADRLGWRFEPRSCHAWGCT